MLIVALLVGWSAASVASAGSMTEEVVLSSYESNPPNATHTSGCGSQADIETSYSADDLEERVGPPTVFETVLPTVIETILPKVFKSELGRWHAILLNDCPKDGWEAMIAKLTPMIETMNKDFADRFPAKGGNILQSPDFPDWVNFVRGVYTDPPESANAAMFMMTGHYKGDDLARALIKAAKIDSTRDIALKLLDVQVETWVKEKREVATVFELLQLKRTEGKLFESPLFRKWVTYVNKLYPHHPDIPNSLELANRVIFTTLQQIYKGRVLATILVEGTKINETEDMAKTLLGFHLTVWAGGRTPTDYIFKLLELDRGEPSERPLYSIWEAFI